MNIRHIRLARWAAPAALTLAISACGGSAQSGESAARAGGGDAPTVSVKQVNGFGAVLVDDQGQTLYTPDQEADGKIRCTKSCTTFWDPLPAGTSAPTAGSAVSGRLAVIRRADDGTRQVTYGGKPLYRFTQDPGPGKVTGDNFMDDFDGTSFTWHAVRSGASADSPSSPSQRSDGY